jgi:uncharacterized protein (DUF2236 family)
MEQMGAEDSGVDVRRTATGKVRAGRSHVDLARPEQSGADPGLFGPDSVTWQVVADPVLVLGGVRSLLLQALHPVAMAGVADHSGFREDPWGRLLRTAEYVGATTYGTTLEAQRAAARVRGVHRRVRGVEAMSGRAYRADDQDLLLWVHCAEVESFLSTVRRCGARLEPGAADRYYAEQVTSAELVGLDPEIVPASEAQMREYFATMRPQLRLSSQAREVARFIVTPPMKRPIVYAGRPLWAGFTALAFGMLPRWARRMYGLPGLPTTDVTASVQGRALRTALLALPRSLREGPHLTAAKERLGLSD